jgi:peroxin-5
MQTQATQSSYLAGNVFGTMANRFGLNMMPQNYLQGFDLQSPILDIKGKGKFKETDFDAAFAQVASSLETGSAKVEGQTSGTVDPVEELEKDLGEAKLDDVAVVTPEDAIRQVEFKRFVAPNPSTALRI